MSIGSPQVPVATAPVTPGSATPTVPAQTTTTAVVSVAVPIPPASMQAEIVFQQNITAFIKDAEAKATDKDGLTLHDVGAIIGEFLHLAVDEANNLTHLSGEDKKGLVMAAVGELYDKFSPGIPLPFGLGFFRTSINTYGKEAVLALASGLIDAIVARMNKPAAAPATK